MFTHTKWKRGFIFYRECRHLKKYKAPELNEQKNQSRITRFNNNVEASIEKRKWRIDNIPETTYNANLPVTDRKDEIIEAIKNNQVIIISGETGSGKTTQLPKFCIAECLWFVMSGWPAHLYAGS